MNTTMRNLTLTAAAFAALMATAPKAAADDRGHGGGRGSAPRQDFRSPAFRGPAFRAPGHAYVAPARPVARYGYGYRYGHAAPLRVVSGFRFYAACPGPGFVYVANYGWAFPPFFGAVWVPGHYDIGGVWVDGFWQ